MHASTCPGEDVLLAGILPWHHSDSLQIKPVSKIHFCWKLRLSPHFLLIPTELENQIKKSSYTHFTAMFHLEGSSEHKGGPDSSQSGPTSGTLTCPVISDCESSLSAEEAQIVQLRRGGTWRGLQGGKSPAAGPLTALQQREGGGTGGAPADVGPSRRTLLSSEL